MKNIWKQALLYSVVLGGGALFAGCTPDEELNLAGYPESIPGITIAETKGSSLVELKATYDSEGKVVLDGPATRTYIITLPTANPEDVTLNVEPILVNIPAEKVNVSATELVIPAGFASAEVTLEVPDNFEFARPDYDAKTYELGIKITDIQGPNVSLDKTEAKVVVAKEAYVANFSITGSSGNEVSFGRVYRDGKIINEEGMSYTFKACLDKPAKSDVKISLAATGLADQFKNDLKITPSELTIRAGEIESAEATWTLTDDFLLTTTEEESHQILLTGAFTSDDKTVQLAGEAANVITFDIQKIFKAIVLELTKPTAWAMYDRSNWGVAGGGSISYGKPASAIDGDVNTDIDGSAFWISLDMLNTKKIVGIAARYYGNRNNYNPAEVAFYMSNDNVTWKEVDRVTISDAEKAGAHFFKFKMVVSSRYVKFEIVKSKGNQTWLGELEVYGTK